MRAHLLGLPPELHYLILTQLVISTLFQPSDPSSLLTLFSNSSSNAHPYLSLLSLRLTHPLFAYILLPSNSSSSSSILNKTREAYILSLLHREAEEEMLSAYLEEGWRTVVMMKLRCYGCLRVLWAERNFNEEEMVREKAWRGGTGAKVRRCLECQGKKVEGAERIECWTGDRQ